MYIDIGKLDLSKVQDVSDFAMPYELVETSYAGEKMDIKDVLDKRICIIHSSTVYKSGANHTKFQFFFLEDLEQKLYTSETMSKNLTDFLEKYHEKLPFKCQIKKFYKFKNMNYGFHTSNA